MTDLVRDLDKKSLEGLASTAEIWKTADEGAATMVVAAFDPKLTGRSLFFLSPSKPRSGKS